MSATVYNLREIRAQRAIERAYQELEKIINQAWEAGAGPGILNGVGVSTEGEAAWYGGAGIDGMKFESPERDPA